MLWELAMPATACQRQAKICQYSIGGPEGRFAGMARSHKNQLFTKTSYSQKPAIHKNQLFTKTSYSQKPAIHKIQPVKKTDSPQKSTNRTSGQSPYPTTACPSSHRLLMASSHIIMRKNSSPSILRLSQRPICTPSQASGSNTSSNGDRVNSSNPSAPYGTSLIAFIQATASDTWARKCSLSSP